MPTATFTMACAGPTMGATITLTYKSAGELPRLEIAGAGTYAVDLAFVPAAGCKGLLVIVDALDASGSPAAPIEVEWTSNALTKSEELAPSVDQPAALMLASPAPVNGITALSIITTGPAVVHVLGLG